MITNLLFQGYSNTFKRRVAIVHLDGNGLFSKGKLKYSVFLASLFASIDKYGGESKSGDVMLDCAIDGGYSRSQYFRHIRQAEDDGYIQSSLRGFNNARVMSMTVSGSQLWANAFCVLLSRDESLDERRIYSSMNIDYGGNQGDIISKTRMAELTGHSFRRIDYDADEHRALWLEFQALENTGQSETMHTGQSETTTGQSEIADRTKRDSVPDKARLYTTNNNYNSNNLNITSVDKSTSDTFDIDIDWNDLEDHEVIPWANEQTSAKNIINLGLCR